LDKESLLSVISLKIFFGNRVFLHGEFTEIGSIFDHHCLKRLFNEIEADDEKEFNINSRVFGNTINNISQDIFNFVTFLWRS